MPPLQVNLEEGEMKLGDAGLEDLCSECIRPISLILHYHVTVTFMEHLQ